MSNPPAAPHRHNVPVKTYTIGMWLFLASLAMLFLSSMLGYVAIRAFAGNRPPFGRLTFPWELWLSTALVLAASLTIHLAVNNVRRERLAAFRKWMVVTSGLAVMFCIVQTPAMIDLLNQHQALKATGLTLYGVVFFLILLHALHVAGGIIFLGLVTFKAFHNRYDHESYIGPRHAAMYWHFLDVVWIVMFSTLLVFG